MNTTVRTKLFFPKVDLHCIVEGSKVAKRRQAGKRVVASRVFLEQRS